MTMFNSINTYGKDGFRIITYGDNSKYNVKWLGKVTISDCVVSRISQLQPIASSIIMRFFISSTYLGYVWLEVITRIPTI
jgi:hypothetical protein